MAEEVAQNAVRTSGIAIQRHAACAGTQARDWQEEAKRLYELQSADAAEAVETYNDAIKRTLEKTDALEKHVKTVTMRADSLAALNVLYGQLCQPRPTHH